MTATDELRRLLDERGVEWFESVTRKGLTWIYRDGKAIRFHPWQPDTLKVSMFDFTTEQAVEATLGRGTCRNLITRAKGQMPMLHCEECGCTTTLNVPSGGAGYAGETEMRWPRFCSNCGRKVRA